LPEWLLLKGDRVVPFWVSVGARMQDDVKDLVLLVDDDFSVRKMHAKVLTRAGFSVEASATGAHALGLLEQGLRVGAIVTDLHMPGLDGLGS
jgi:CheY-like chemotaxis protein